MNQKFKDDFLKHRKESFIKNIKEDIERAEWIKTNAKKDIIWNINYTNNEIKRVKASTDMEDEEKNIEITMIQYRFEKNNIEYEAKVYESERLIEFMQKKIEFLSSK